MRIAVVFAALIIGMGTSFAADEITDTTPCEIVENPMAFSGKMVRVRGEIFSAFEVADIRAECNTGSAMIALWYPDMVRDSNAPNFKLVKDKSFRELEAAIKRKGGGICIGPCPPSSPNLRILATFVGRLDGPDKLVAKDKDGSTIRRSTFGFTSSMHYTTRVVLKSVSEVCVIE